MATCKPSAQYTELHKHNRPQAPWSALHKRLASCSPRPTANSCRLLPRHSVLGQASGATVATPDIANSNRSSSNYDADSAKNGAAAPAFPHSSAIAVPRTPSGLQTDGARGTHKHDHLTRPGPAGWLQELYIRDFALVKEQTVTFGLGVNAITGESGSGKSVLIEALGQILGAAAPSECVRAPAHMAVVQGTFTLAPALASAARQLLSSCGLPAKALPAEGEACTLVIRREITEAAGGMRSKVSINGCASSLRVLKELGSLLVDTNGQHAALTLRDANAQLMLLDRLAGTTALARRFVSFRKQVSELEDRLEALHELGDEEERSRLQKLCDLVTKSRIRVGEELELRGALKRMESRRVAVEMAASTRAALSGDGGGGVLDAMRAIETQLRSILVLEDQIEAQKKGAKEMAKTDSEDGEAVDGHEDDEQASEEGVAYLDDAVAKLKESKQLISQAESMVKAYTRVHQFDPEEQARISERLQRLEKLFKANGVRSSADLLARAKEAEKQLELFYDMEGKEDEWLAELEALEKRMQLLAVTLSRRRRAAAMALKAAVESCLQQLAMGGSRFDVRIAWEQVPETSPRAFFMPTGTHWQDLSETPNAAYYLQPTGLDTVQFMLAAGPAEPLRPLAAVASGGESARVMLALKAAPSSMASKAPKDDAASRHQSEASHFKHQTASSHAHSDLGSVPSTASTPQAIQLHGQTGSVFSSPPSSHAAASCTSHQQNSTSQSDQQHTNEIHIADDELQGEHESELDTVQSVPVMVLDELDSGMGARLGNSVGQILRRMTSGPAAANSQIICVTHLPQVACYASHHIKVAKSQDSSGRVTTHFELLEDFPDRAGEVASMLGLDYGVASNMLMSAQIWNPFASPPLSSPSEVAEQGQSDAQQGSIAQVKLQVPAVIASRIPMAPPPSSSSHMMGNEAGGNITAVGHTSSNATPNSASFTGSSSTSDDGQVTSSFLSQVARAAAAPQVAAAASVTLASASVAPSSSASPAADTAVTAAGAPANNAIPTSATDPYQSDEDDELQTTVYRTNPKALYVQAVVRVLGAASFASVEQRAMQTFDITLEAALNSQGLRRLYAAAATGDAEV